MRQQFTTCHSSVSVQRCGAGLLTSSSPDSDWGCRPCASVSQGPARETNSWGVAGYWLCRDEGLRSQPENTGAIQKTGAALNCPHPSAGRTRVEEVWAEPRGSVTWHKLSTAWVLRGQHETHNRQRQLLLGTLSEAQTQKKEVLSLPIFSPHSPSPVIVSCWLKLLDKNLGNGAWQGSPLFPSRTAQGKVKDGSQWQAWLMKEIEARRLQYMLRQRCMDRERKDSNVPWEPGWLPRQNLAEGQKFDEITVVWHLPHGFSSWGIAFIQSPLKWSDSGFSTLSIKPSGDGSINQTPYYWWAQRNTPARIPMPDACLVFPFNERCLGS